jgi:hypothetical protein
MGVNATRNVMEEAYALAAATNARHEVRVPRDCPSWEASRTD